MKFSGIVRIVFIFVLAQLEFAVLIDLVFRIGSKLPCLFPFLFYFIVDPVTFIFLWIPCRFFSCFACVIPIRHHLTLVARALALDVWFI